MEAKLTVPTFLTKMPNLSIKLTEAARHHAMNKHQADPKLNLTVPMKKTKKMSNNGQSYAATSEAGTKNFCNPDDIIGICYYRFSGLWK